MAVPDRKVADAYTRRALLLLRYVNRLSALNDKQLNQLARLILGYLISMPDGYRALQVLLRNIRNAITTTYQDMATLMGDQLSELLEIEAKWAIGVGSVDTAPTAEALRLAIRDMLVLGHPIDEIVAVAGDALFNQIAARVRDAVTFGDLARLQSILGDGRALRGGLLDKAKVTMASVADTAVSSSAYAGRLASWQASGINALEWHSVMDMRTTVGCAIRNGLLYDLNFQPIGHDVPIDRPPPRHYNCRSILLPLLLPDINNPPPRYNGDTFGAFLKRHSIADQDAMLGKGRAEMWRKGVITLHDLIGQSGQTLTLGDLREAA